MIPFLDLKRQYATIADDLEPAVLAALRSGSYVLGEPVARFEEAFAAFCGARHAIAVSTGTSALHLALLAAGVLPGDEVITVPTTFVATVAAILYVGARPVLVDVDPVTWNMDPDAAAAAITPRTRAILPVHFHGRLADMERLGRLARDNDLALIEDACQAHGAMRDGRRAGTFGALGCFSFYPGKNLGAAGEGGAVVTDDDALADHVRCLRDWGQAARHVHVRKGYNFRMDALQGAVLGVKLPHLEDWNGRRRAIANAYHAGLSPDIARAAGPFGDDHSCHVYAIRTGEPEKLRDRLAEAGVGTNIHYPYPVHLQPAYSSLGYRRGDFPVAEDYASTTLSLPIFPELTAAECAHVIDLVNTFAARAPAVAARAELVS